MRHKLKEEHLDDDSSRWTSNNFLILCIIWQHRYVKMPDTYSSDGHMVKVLKHYQACKYFLRECYSITCNYTVVIQQRISSWLATTLWTEMLAAVFLL